MFKAFNSWKDVWFQQCAQTIFFQKQHGARKIRETSINYKHPMLWNNADSNYRNNVNISLIKVKLLTLFAGEFLEEFLGKCFHSLRTSVTREMKKSANGNESKLSFKQKRIHGGHPLTNWYMEQVIRIIFPSKTDSHWKIKLEDLADLSLIVF